MGRFKRRLDGQGVLQGGHDMKKSLWLFAVFALCASGCDEMQSQAMIGTLLGSTLGSQMGKDKDRGRNAMIGAGVGLLGGMLANQMQQKNTAPQYNQCPQYAPQYQQPQYQQPQYQQPQYQQPQQPQYQYNEDQYSLQQENERLRRENERLRYVAPNAPKPKTYYIIPAQKGPRYPGEIQGSLF